jgi:outer membrane protein
MTKSNTSISASAPNSDTGALKTGGRLRPAFGLALFAALCLSFTWPLAASAAEKIQPMVALLVDVQRVLDESQAAKGAQKQMDAQRARFQSETEKEENQLRQAEQDLGKSHDHLTAAAYADREQQLRQRFMAVERHVEARRKLLDQSFTDAMNVVRDALLTIVQSVARERGANLVLVKQQVLWADKPLDVTEEVLARLNKALPQAAVKLPEEDKNAPTP